MSVKITLNQGSGGKLTHRLIEDVFMKYFDITEPLSDSALIKNSGTDLAFTTDSFVVDPLFFPGGNIGKLSVCGTVNDLAVSGAIPLSLSAAFIIEEGFSLDDLVEIVKSMADEAGKAGIRIITGDTKVVEKGKCDKLFITTTGLGKIDRDLWHISLGERIKPGDRIIINGPVGNHALAVLGAREQLSFRTPVISDCASLNHLIRKVLAQSSGIHFMRDLTRGGLATVLNEIKEIAGHGISIDEEKVPVDEPVMGLCEMLGFDPLYLANEGKIVIVAEAGEESKIIDIMRSDPLGRESEVIGDVSGSEKNRVILNTAAGGKRILEMASGVQLPRIC
ncbi:MAG: hydrogenase expression/formation protein HypE [Bacteroidales bacterium]|jgi:hydrogenase expression/formation protein HypE